MNYNYDSLNGLIVEKFHTRGNFAKKLGLSERSLSLKLNNKVPFKQTEIDRAVRILEIDPTTIKEYFFTKQVQNN